MRYSNNPGSEPRGQRTPLRQDPMNRMMVLAGFSITLYTLNRLWLISTFPQIAFFSRYFGDLLALPVYLPMSYYLAWRLQLIPTEFKVKPVHVLAAAIIFSVLFEGLIPIVDSSSYRDWGDVMTYFIGATLVYIVGRSRLAL